MVAQGVANWIWSYATLELEPGVEARATLEAAMVRVGRDMDPQHASITWWAFATLSHIFGCDVGERQR